MDFSDGLALLAEEGVAADLVYMDLGISSAQVDTWERGFSYSYDAPLDMRMDTAQELDARTVVNEWEQRRLEQIFSNYGEERYSRQIAAAIVRTRERRRSRAPTSSWRSSRAPRRSPRTSPGATRPGACSRPSASR